MIRGFFIAVLAVSMHITLCTGGIVALATDAADAIAYRNADNAPMSYGSIGYLTCEISKHKDGTVGSVHSGGCSDARSCFSQAGSILLDRSIPLITTAMDALSVPIISEQPVSITDLRPSYSLARAGPLYTEAESLSHILLKRE